MGASPRAERDSYICMQVLLEQGYQVIPVNPREAGKPILGQRCYASLADIEQPVDMVEKLQDMVVLKCTLLRVGTNNP